MGLLLVRNAGKWKRNFEKLRRHHFAPFRYALICLGNKSERHQSYFTFWFVGSLRFYDFLGKCNSIPVADSTAMLLLCFFLIYLWTCGSNSPCQDTLLFVPGFALNTIGLKRCLRVISCVKDFWKIPSSIATRIYHKLSFIVYNPSIVKLDINPIAINPIGTVHVLYIYHNHYFSFEHNSLPNWATPCTYG